MRSMPAPASSSTTYCTTGLRPTGSISFGCDLVAGSKRVPRPATGTTAVMIVIGRGGCGVQYEIQVSRLSAAHCLKLELSLHQTCTAGERMLRHANSPKVRRDRLLLCRSVHLLERKTAVVYQVRRKMAYAAQR